MSTDTVFRKATEADIPFLVETIIEGERVGSNTVCYQRMFGLQDNELVPFLTALLSDDTPDHDFTYTSYYLAEYKGRVIAGVAGFIECNDDVPSKIIKANLIARYLGIPRWKTCQPALKIVSALDIERTPKALQLEYAFTKPHIRAIDVMENLCRHIMRTKKAAQPALQICEAQSTLENKGIARLARNVGWYVHETKQTESPEVLQFLPRNNRVVRRYIYDETKII